MARQPKKTSAGNCELCGIFRPYRHRDHITPKFLGGGDEPENIQMLCGNCHEDKTVQDRLTPEWQSKMSEIAKARTYPKGHTRSEATKQKMREGWARRRALGLTNDLSDEQRRAIGERRAAQNRARAGESLSEQHRKAIAEGSRRTAPTRIRDSEGRFSSRSGVPQAEAEAAP